MLTLKKWCMVALTYATFGNFVLLAFIIVQILDGVFTYIAVQNFGIGAEGNPILAQWMILLGQGTVLIGAKVIAILCGIVLRVAGVNHVLVGLTLLYIVASLQPWANLFSVVQQAGL